MNINDVLGKKKTVIGMIHLKELPIGSKSESLNEVYEAAKHDLLALESGNADAAIVENFFNQPYSDNVERTTLIAYVNILTKLKEIANIPLGVNLQYTSDTEEMEVATICNASFIRSETFVETRGGSYGILYPQAPKVMNYKNQSQSDVLVFADINVKHTFPVFDQPIEYSIHEAIQAGADALILTGMETGKSPTVEDAKKFKEIAGDQPIYIGSGVQESNINDFLKFADGVIVGSSIKEDGKIDRPIDKEKVKKLVASIN
ncbi:BtpA/SgcQ family protein [Oceanobacillus sojae]|uniref:BtpA/SgcQ family protein n=1 Tax=Oceanobacillus sojae TaxID=582851 RepID=UPI0021A8F55B|nr:BtpA/SgcQ family protein [Oceanobacillus sojae]MCT1901929.1 BtpA/SgcQ family protein [Oceanobacillus sojae]